jgi:hypothetical protein
MKRLLSTSLALLLVMASLGHVLAAVCPHAFGRECCFAKTSSHTNSSSFNHENMAPHDMHMDGMSMDGISMDGMNMDDMAMGETSMDHSDMLVAAATAYMSIRLSPPAFREEAVANKFHQPLEACAHCLQSGIVSAPLSFVSISTQSGKAIGSVLMPVSRFQVRPAITLAHIRWPREHAPPGSSPPRHILISVFLI